MRTNHTSPDMDKICEAGLHTCAKTILKIFILFQVGITSHNVPRREREAEIILCCPICTKPICLNMKIYLTSSYSRNHRRSSDRIRLVRIAKTFLTCNVYYSRSNDIMDLQSKVSHCSFCTVIWGYFDRAGDSFDLPTIQGFFQKFSQGVLKKFPKLNLKKFPNYFSNF